MYCNLLELQGSKSRVPSQNGVSQAWYIVEIHHSGRKPSKWTKQFVLSMNSFILHESKMTSQQCWWTWPAWKNENCLEGTEFSWGDGSVREYKKKRKKKIQAIQTQLAQSKNCSLNQNKNPYANNCKIAFDRICMHLHSQTNIHTEINAYIHTYIHTYRQTVTESHRQTDLICLSTFTKKRETMLTVLTARSC